MIIFVELARQIQPLRETLKGKALVVREYAVLIGDQADKGGVYILQQSLPRGLF